MKTKKQKKEIALKKAARALLFYIDAFGVHDEQHGYDTWMSARLRVLVENLRQKAVSI